MNKIQESILLDSITTPTRRGFLKWVGVSAVLAAVKPLSVFAVDTAKIPGAAKVHKFLYADLTPKQRERFIQYVRQYAAALAKHGTPRLRPMTDLPTGKIRMPEVKNPNVIDGCF